MGYYRIVTWRNTVDPKHGLGILFDQDRVNDAYNKCFLKTEHWDQEGMCPIIVSCSMNCSGMA